MSQVTINNIALAFKLYFNQTLNHWSECLVLLDPATGRVIDTDNLNKNAAKRTVIKNGVKRNRVANRRSDYISPSGVPLYKLRKRNPFGFGGWWLILKYKMLIFIMKGDLLSLFHVLSIYNHQHKVIIRVLWRQRQHSCCCGNFLFSPG